MQQIDALTQVRRALAKAQPQTCRCYICGTDMGVPKHKAAHPMAPAVRSLVLRLKAQGVPNKIIALVTGVSLSTLKSGKPWLKK